MEGFAHCEEGRSLQGRPLGSSCQVIRPASASDSQAEIWARTELGALDPSRLRFSRKGEETEIQIFEEYPQTKKD